MTDRNAALRLSFEVAISLLLVFFIIAWCIQILLPFLSLILWGAVIAISLHGAYCTLRNRVGGKAAAVLFGLTGTGIVLIPAALFAESIYGAATQFAQNVNTGSFTISPPPEAVKGWPLVGEKVFAIWTEAAQDFERFLSDFAPQLKDLATFGLSKAAGLGITVLVFLGSTIIATVMLANDKAVAAGMRRLFVRLVGPDAAEEHLALTTATIRSVTMGVLGVAFIQAVAAGLGMVAVGLPGAGIWAVVILVLAIAQLPPLIVLLPAIIYVFSHESTVVASVFAVWSLVVAFGDAFLKPMLLGRGVDVPTLVILLGAIGGMLTSGLIGLFVGAVVLALGYKLMLLWLSLGETDTGGAVTDSAGPNADTGASDAATP